VRHRNRKTYAFFTPTINQIQNPTIHQYAQHRPLSCAKITRRTLAFKKQKLISNFTTSTSSKRSKQISSEIKIYLSLLIKEY
jgi:hypothetical protein